MLDAIGSAPLAGATYRRSAGQLTARLAGLGPLVASLFAPAVFGVLALLGGAVMISYAAYTVHVALGHAVVGVCLLVLGHLLVTPAPVPQPDESAQGGQPRR